MKNIIFKKAFVLTLVIFLTHCGGSNENFTANPPKGDSLEKPKETILDVFQLPKDDDLQLRNIQELPSGEYDLTQIQGYAKAEDDNVFVKFAHKLNTPGVLNLDLDILSHKLILKDEFSTAFNLTLKIIKSEQGLLNLDQVSFQIQAKPNEKKWNFFTPIDMNLFSFEKNLKTTNLKIGIYDLEKNSVYLTLNENKFIVFIKSKGDHDEVYLRFEYQKVGTVGQIEPKSQTPEKENIEPESLIQPTEVKTIKKTPVKSKPLQQKPINDVVDANQFLTTLNEESKFKVECDPTLGLDLCLPALKELNKIRANFYYPHLKILISDNMGSLDFKNQITLRFKASGKEIKDYIEKEIQRKKVILQKIHTLQLTAKKYYSSVSCDEKLITPEDCLIAVNKLVGEIASGVNNKSFKIIISDKNRPSSKNIIYLSYFQKTEEMAEHILNQML